MPPGLNNLRHIVVLMMENRSFDHMLGGLTATHPKIDGITPGLSNPDTVPPRIGFPRIRWRIFRGSSSLILTTISRRSICRFLVETPAPIASPACRGS
jgi:hypothetical protein